jgi:hypothetical protein
MEKYENWFSYGKHLIFNGLFRYRLEFIIGIEKGQGRE